MRVQAWRDEALCAEVGLDLFFTVSGGSPKPAKKICGACDVKQECLDWVMANDDGYGVFGGLTAIERDAKRRAA